MAKVNNLVFAITPNASVRYAKLRTNEGQIGRYPNPSDLPAMRANPNIGVQSAQMATTNYIYFRTDQGTGTPAVSLVPPAPWG